MSVNGAEGADAMGVVAEGGGAGGMSVNGAEGPGFINHPRLCKFCDIVTFVWTALILSHGKLLSMPQVAPILTNMYITHNNTHLGP